MHRKDLLANLPYGVLKMPSYVCFDVGWDLWD